MSATTSFSRTATTPFSEAASLEHYTSKTPRELKVLAKLRSLSDAGRQQEIVARLMAQDGETGTWPGMYERSGTDSTKSNVRDEKKRGEGSGAAPIEQVSSTNETLSETKVAAEGKLNHASSATIFRHDTGASSIGSKNGDAAIPMSQLADEWDQQWGAPFAFPRAATIDNKARSKSVTTAESVSNASKTSVSPTSPISPASPASSTTTVSPASPASSPAPISSVSPTSPPSSTSNQYNVLLLDEEEEVTEQENKENKEIPPMETNAEKAPSVHDEAEKILLVHEGKEEEVPPANNDDVDAGEETKKKKKKQRKRGNKGGKKASNNKAGTESAGTETTETTKVTQKPEVNAPGPSPEDIHAPASPTRSESAEAFLESDIDVSGSTPVAEQDNRAIIEPLPSVAPTEMDGSVDKQFDLSESLPIDGLEESTPPAEILALKPPGEASNLTPAKPTKKAIVQIFLVTPPPSPPRSTQTAPSPSEQVPSAPTMTKNQRRNEKRRQNNAVAPSNVYAILTPDDSADDFAPDSSDEKDDADDDRNSEISSPRAAKKSNKWGKKGGKKIQKKHQAVAPVLHATAVIQSKIEPMQAVGLVMTVSVFVVAFGAWVVA
jgi:hypothetical protein